MRLCGNDELVRHPIVDCEVSAEHAALQHPSFKPTSPQSNVYALQLLKHIVRAAGLFYHALIRDHMRHKALDAGDAIPIHAVPMCERHVHADGRRVRTAAAGVRVAQRPERFSN